MQSAFAYVKRAAYKAAYPFKNYDERIWTRLGLSCYANWATVALTSLVMYRCVWDAFDFLLFGFLMGGCDFKLCFYSWLGEINISTIWSRIFYIFPKRKILNKSHIIEILVKECQTTVYNIHTNHIYKGKKLNNFLFNMWR